MLTSSFEYFPAFPYSPQSLLVLFSLSRENTKNHFGNFLHHFSSTTSRYLGTLPYHPELVTIFPCATLFLLKLPLLNPCVCLHLLLLLDFLNHPTNYHQILPIYILTLQLPISFRLDLFSFLATGFLLDSEITDKKGRRPMVKLLLSSHFRRICILKDGF